MSRFLDAVSERVILLDGAMGTQVQARQLDVEKDFLGCENCTEILNRSRPDLVRDIHRATSRPARTRSRPTPSAARR